MAHIAERGGCDGLTRCSCEGGYFSPRIHHTANPALAAVLGLGIGTQVTSHGPAPAWPTSRVTSLFPRNFQPSTSTFPHFKYRIESKPHDRPATIGSLQVGDAANSRRFRPRASPAYESRRQTGHRTSCVLLVVFLERDGPFVRNVRNRGPPHHQPDRSSRAPRPIQHLAPSCDPCGSWIADVSEMPSPGPRRVFYSQPPQRENIPGFSFVCRPAPPPSKRLRGRLA